MQISFMYMLKNQCYENYKNYCLNHFKNQREKWRNTKCIKLANKYGLRKTITKADNGDFDVTIGSHDGLKVRELVGLFMLMSY